MKNFKYLSGCLGAEGFGFFCVALRERIVTYGWRITRKHISGQSEEELSLCCCCPDQGMGRMRIMVPWVKFPGTQLWDVFMDAQVYKGVPFWSLFGRGQRKPDWAKGGVELWWGTTEALAYPTGSPGVGMALCHRPELRQRSQLFGILHWLVTGCSCPQGGVWLWTKLLSWPEGNSRTTQLSHQLPVFLEAGGMSLGPWRGIWAMHCGIN